MPARGFKTITVRDTTEERLKVRWDHEKTARQSFSNYVDGILAERLDYQDAIEKYGAFLDFFIIEDNRILLKDLKADKNMAAVQIRVSPKKELWCEEHERNDCIHVGFCYSVKKVYDKLIENGFKPPKKI